MAHGWRRDAVTTFGHPPPMGITPHLRTTIASAHQGLKIDVADIRAGLKALQNHGPNGTAFLSWSCAAQTSPGIASVSSP